MWCSFQHTHTPLSIHSIPCALHASSSSSVLLLEDVDAAFVGRTTAEAGGTRLTFSGLLNAIDGVRIALLPVQVVGMHMHAPVTVCGLEDQHSCDSTDTTPWGCIWHYLTVSVTAYCRGAQVVAQEGRLLFMTTNHVDRLSSALIRPGRVDVRCHLGAAGREQARRLFLSFFSDAMPLTREQKATDLDALATAFAEQLPEEEELSMASLQGLLMTHRKDPQAAVAAAPTLLPSLKT
jgi:SpoVK/Ycf46/Vps4 family AAA+-type ATPase